MDRLPRLDARLRALASLVRPGARLADVGCDHGYLIAWLCASGRIPGGYACDINEKPLQKAAFTLSACGVAGRVKTLCCDGLSGLSAGQVDDVVVAGMGGDLIWEIVGAPDWTRDPALRFVLQPMTKPEHLRRALYRNGFTLLREVAVVSKGFPYSVLLAAYDGACREVSDAFAHCGLLLEDGGEAARRYVEKAARLVRERVDGLERAGGPGPALERQRALLKELEGRCGI